MTISVFDLFSIGIGPSSSHTVGPMKAAHAFITQLIENKELDSTKQIIVELFGSLAFTGKGHGTDKAILLGLEGNLPNTIDPDIIQPRASNIISQKQLNLAGNHLIQFDYEQDFIFNFKDLLPHHTNGMRFSAVDDDGKTLRTGIYYSIGGGFILDEQQAAHTPEQVTTDVTYPFTNAKTLLSLCEAQKLTIKELMLANELAFRSQNEIESGLMQIANIMQECIAKGCETSGILPGGLNIKRRAPYLHTKLQEKGRPTSHAMTDSMAWLNMFAIAVNEENAAGGRVVTAPTNGATGIIPAVLHY